MDLAVGSGSPWVVNVRRRNDVGFTGPVATGVSKLVAATGAERDEVPLRTRAGAVSNRSDNHIAVRGTGVWVVTPYYDVVRIDAATGLITKTADAVPAEAVATGPAGVWVVGGDGWVARLDPVSANPIVRTRVPAAGSVGSIAVGTDAVWVTFPDDGTLWLASSGLTPVSLLFEQSLGATLGMYVAVVGVRPPAPFPPAGVRWAKRFAVTQPGGRVEPEAVQA